MRKLNYYIIDSFTAEPYSGNPAAVVLDADGLETDEMQAIAREFNLSETSFLTQPHTPEGAVGLRWFTPEVEVDLCGHATIAAVHGLMQSGRFISLPEEKGTILPIQTPKHLLTVRCEALSDEDTTVLIWLDLPTPRLKKKAFSPSLWGEVLDVPADAFDKALPAMETQDGDMLVFVSTLPALLEAQPKFAELATHCTQQRIRGVCLATTQTLTDSTDVQSRFFAPAVGVNEDPVTGSVHGPLAAYLVGAGQVPMLGDYALVTCIQAKSGGRAGLVRAVVRRKVDEGFDVRIGGQCVTVMKGELYA